MAKVFGGVAVGQRVRSGEVNGITQPRQGRRRTGQFAGKQAGLLVGRARGASKGESKRAKAAKIARFKAKRAG